MSGANIKVKPARGRMPTLQFCRPAELRIDPTYQRDISAGPSQTLIRRIAQEWDWDLCQPLVVARRSDLVERLFVIDGQHRLAAARLRGDIDQLPCVIVSYASAAEEAASFVALNQRRRPLNALEIFKASVASGDETASAIVSAMADAGLSLAPHGNYTAWKPGMVSNVGGITRAWARHGSKATALAMRLLSQAFGGEVLRYAGTIFPGLVAICADEIARNRRFEDTRFERCQTMLALRGQDEWRKDINRAKADDGGMNFAASAEKVLRAAWAKSSGDGLPPAKFEGQRWCDQCDMMISAGQLACCRSRFCSLKVAA